MSGIILTESSAKAETYKKSFGCPPGSLEIHLESLTEPTEPELEVKLLTTHIHFQTHCRLLFSIVLCLHV